jgi:hypothetical protein
MSDQAKGILGDNRLAAKYQQTEQAAREMRGIEKRRAANRTDDGARQYAIEYRDWLRHWGRDIADAVVDLDRDVRGSRRSAAKNSEITDFEGS